MHLIEREIRKLQLESGEVPFDVWFNEIRDRRAQIAIDARLARVRAGNFGDHKAVEEGVWELRLHYGPGLRIYFGQHGARIVVLIGGGAKSTQGRDIRRAQKLWKDFQENAPKKL